MIRYPTLRLSALAYVIVLSLFIPLVQCHHRSYQGPNVNYTTYNETDISYRSMIFMVQPRGRGTWGILLSCTTTFVFCVWTTIHPNVIPNSKGSQRFLYKISMMVLGIVNPEGLVILAYGQWSDAKKLNRECVKYFEKMEEPSIKFVKDRRKRKGKKEKLYTDEEFKKKQEKLRENWLGVEAAFFVVMGGFAIDVTKKEYEDEEKIPMETWTRIKLKCRKRSTYIATLTPRGFLDFLESKQFEKFSFEKPPFEKRDLRDKGCTVLLFYFWWHKPLDVHQPICLHLTLNGGKLFTPIQDIENEEQHTLTSALDLATEGPIIDPATAADFNESNRTAHSYQGVALGRNSSEDRNEITTSENMRISPSATHNISGPPKERHDDLDHKQSLLQQLAKAMHAEIGKGLTEAHHAHDDEERRTITDKNGASVTEKSETPDIRLEGIIDMNQYTHPLRRQYFISRAPANHIAISNRALHDVIFSITGGMLEVEQDTKKWPRAHIGRMFVEGLFITLVAGLHVLAGQIHFPTDVERWWWRASCIGRVVFPTPVILLASITKYHVDLSKLLWNNHMARYSPFQWCIHSVICIYRIAESHSAHSQGKIFGRSLKMTFHLPVLIVCVALLLSYFVCIFYITGEAYVSLRKPPPKSFMTPQWTNYLPHI
ncbi:hypothetical protein FPQ18DRAFT_416347 [Pyronema domesticum]|nr:hypothetical protein FPQ18DRAFT_416347 [Pyronema domesticum]